MSNSTSIHSMILGALFFGAATLAPSVRAQSCSDSAPVVHSSYPADGAMGVPTNAPLYLYGPELEMGSADITLQDESGEAVSIDVQPADGGLLVDAFLGLEPSTAYELTVTLRGEEWSATFTTGTGPALLVQLRAPDVSVSVIEQDQGTCGVVSAICVLGSVSTSRTLEVLVGDEVLSLGGGEPAPMYLAGGGTVAENECIEVRVREPGGSVSESTRLCGDELGRFELDANAPAPTSCQSYVPGSEDESAPASESGGCAMGASGAAPDAGGLSFGLAALLAMGWRSARRRRREA